MIHGNPTSQGVDNPLAFAGDEAFARELDARDTLASYRHRFHLPQRPDGRPMIYFCGNSLGLQPKTVRPLLDEELRFWADRAVDGHFEGPRPWYSYHEQVRETGARLVGALPGEVVMMNSLTVNLHLMLVSFYRPTARRHRIMMEYPVFPSDTYAVKTQLGYHGHDPADSLVIVAPRAGSHLVHDEDFERVLIEQGESIAVVLLAGVNFFTGQRLDISRITASAHRKGCLVGWDLAHAAGNVPLNLHAWDVDFAVWCNYKYLNSGPGAIGGCFVHARHCENPLLPRFGGWWGNDPKSRFLMHLQPDFVPVASADGWQLSNPPIMALAPVKASLDLFDEAGMTALRAKSMQLTAYLQFLIDQIETGRFEVITPRDPEQRGCQLSILVHDRSGADGIEGEAGRAVGGHDGSKRRDVPALLAALHANGVTCDFREPNVIRVAPTPLYNTFHEVWMFAQILKAHAE